MTTIQDLDELLGIDSVAHPEKESPPLDTLDSLDSLDSLDRIQLLQNECSEWERKYGELQKMSKSALAVANRGFEVTDSFCDWRNRNK